METLVRVKSSNFNMMETMGSEDSEEVQYVYDESEMVLGGPDDFNNITDLMLEDGTRAMIVNGTLVTADGQTLVLQDGSDLSQYYVDENTDEILLSQEQEEQFFGIISSEDSTMKDDVVAYIQGSENSSHDQNEVFYIHNGDQVIPIQEQYQLAEIDDSENGGAPMQVLKLENQVVEGMDGVIDLEQFLNQQGIVQLEGENYQYAVLTDGKFHIQTINEQHSNVESSKHKNDSNGETILEPSTDLSYMDLSSIRGKDINTGQPITLSRYINRINTRHKKKEIHSKNETRIKYKEKYKNTNNPTSTTAGLKNLINKKITIGKTDKGKLLVGKIINVTKKTEESTHTFKGKNSVGKNITLKRKIVLPPKENKNIFNVAKQDKVNNMISDKKIEIKQSSSGKNQQSKDSRIQISNSKPPPTPSLQTNYDEDSTAASSSNSKSSQTTTITASSDLKLTSDAIVIPVNGTEAETVEKENKVQSPTKNKNSTSVETLPEKSRIVVHKKVVTKDCFEVITRTLTGLMNMDSVIGKLKNKTIIIKIIEKTYNRYTGDYSKSISYCTGYMVREYQLNEEADNFSESWTFIPDTNPQDTILGEDDLETVTQEPLAVQNNLKRIANLTIQITINPQGCRTTRVIINPPNTYKCKECFKSFRTNSALKVHASDFHTPASLECTACSIKFKTYQESKEHFSIHQVGDNKGMYECMECNKRFDSSLLLRKHMDIHFKPLNCPHCNQCFFNARELKNHLPIHDTPQVAIHPTELLLGQSTHDGAGGEGPKQLEQKIYCCHICGRQFSRHSNLQRHIEIHQGEGAMYKCSICNCSYHYVSSLTRHVVTCHVDITNKRSQKKREESDTRNNSQFFQNDQIVKMIHLEDMSADNLQYATEAIDQVTENLDIEEGVEILQVDEGGIVLENQS